MFLLPMRGSFVLTPEIYLMKTVAQEPPDALCESAQRHLVKFKEMVPEKHFYDLASNPEHRFRTESVDGALCTLTTNTHLWNLGF